MEKHFHPSRLLVALVASTFWIGTLNAQYVDDSDIEYTPFDGYYNNFAHPEWGASETTLLRLIPPEYADGVYAPSGADRPNPLEIAQIVFDGDTGFPSYRNRSALLVFFGQQVVEEILDAQSFSCPPEYINIPIPKCHHLYDPDCKGGREMPIQRGRFDAKTGLSPNVPREQINEISSYFDGTLMYGPNKAWSDVLRSFKDGLLAALNDTNSSAWYFPAQNLKKLPYANPPPPRDHVLKPVNRFYTIGNPRGNENPFLLTMGILWFRFHNFKARQLKVGHPNWSDEKLFQEARKWTIATHQRIVYYEWLVAWLGEGLEPYTVQAQNPLAKNAAIEASNGSVWPMRQHIGIPNNFIQGFRNNEEVFTLSYYELKQKLALGTSKKTPRSQAGYNPTVHPQIAHVFQSAAFRFGHTLIPPGVFRRDANCTFRNTSTVTVNGEVFQGVRTCNSYWNSPDIVAETDIDEILMGMASQITEREDNIVTPDLHGFVFGGLDFSRRDLMAVNIQRGRDHGLTDYNTARAAFGLPKLNSFSDFANINPNATHNLYNTKPWIFSNLSALLGEDGINKLDIWPGGMLETTELGPGPLFRAIIMNQFSRIRDGDRFWFENKANGLFTDDEIAEIHNTTIRDVILAVTNIPPDTIQEHPFFHQHDDPCPQPFQLSDAQGLEPCTPLKVYDYFSGSETSYILTLILIFGSVIPIVIALLLCAFRHKAIVKQGQTQVRLQSKKRMPDNMQSITVTEWIGKKKSSRLVTMMMDVDKKQIRIVNSRNGSLFRTIDVSMINPLETIEICMSADSKMSHMIIRIPKEYDVVLRFDSPHERPDIMAKLKNFLEKCGNGVTLAAPTILTVHALKAAAITRDVRQKVLESFFSAVFAHVLHFEQAGRRHSMITPELDTNILTCELTKYEFAEALGMRADSIFIDNLFKMVDKTQNGYISFREFLDFFVIFAHGSPDEKAKLMFDMYDIKQSGVLSKADFKLMLKSLIELASEKVKDDNIDNVVDVLFKNSNLDNNATLTFDDFNSFLRQHRDELNYASLDFAFNDSISAAGTNHRERENAQTKARRTMIRAYSLDLDNNKDTFQRSQSTLDDIKPIERDESTSLIGRKWSSFAHLIELYRRQIFWLTLYLLVTFGIFIERAYYYSAEREQSGLRRICGYGVSITRGAASAQMFTYVSLIVVMCRNIIVYLRGTFLNRYIPFDNAVGMHKFIAYLAAFFTVVHVVGHAFNFYAIPTQPPNDLSCLFRNYYHPTNALPTFSRWAWQTLTGVTGIILTIQLILIQTFSTEYARKKTYRAFWLIHRSYPIFFIFMLLHGAGRLIQAPFLYYFCLGPFILFTIDQLISVSRRRIEIPVTRAEILPSDVIELVICKPPNFEYHAGQFIRIACLGHSRKEFHPFTLTSAPYEDELSVHIRAVGPWTRNIRKLYDRQSSKIPLDGSLPKVIIDGPYGEGHQDWNKYEVSILIGAGIGVTPFASILKQIAHASKTSNFKQHCQKVYFLWVTRTQHQFEWLTDIIREVEQADRRNIVSVHVFITQFKEKFDFRTTMLYICERHFQKISHRSLFTGLKSITHFGRPDFHQLFKLIMAEHPETDVFGVFSCGPPPILRSVEKACSLDNRWTRDVLFVHHSENF